MTQLFTNNATSELASALASGATSLTLKTGDGALFPSPTGGDFFLLTLYQRVGAAEANYEIVKCTARASDVLTVTRAQEDTPAREFAAADPAELRLTAGSIAAKQDAGAGGGGVDVQIFTSSGTWTKPVGAKYIRGIAIGAGGPGGSGARMATTSIRTGGGGGGGGAYTPFEFIAAQLGATETVVVGVSANGGAGITTDSANGNSSTINSATAGSSFAGVIRSQGGSQAAGGSVFATAGGAPSASASLSSSFSGLTGGGCAVTGVASNGGDDYGIYGALGGGGGGGAPANTTTSQKGGNGGSAASGNNVGMLPARAGGSGGTTAGVAPTTGATGVGKAYLGAGGGGGGAYRSGQAGQAGADGGFPGGGGGGGAASDNGFVSGAGGKGGGGIVIIVSFS